MPESNADGNGNQGGEDGGKVSWPNIPRLKQKFDKDGLPLGPLEQLQQGSPVRRKSSVDRLIGEKKKTEMWICVHFRMG